MALKKPNCFGSFNFSSEECSICSNFNIDCILKTQQQEICFNSAIQGNPSECVSSSCPPDIRSKCTSARYILEKIKERVCFSEPGIKAECFECNLFDNCEAAELMRQNLNLTIERAKDLLKTQISEMLKEEGQCFGDFSFEEACWNECQWAMRCLKISGIIPGKNCKHYHKDGATPAQCSACNFKNFCQGIFNSEKEIERLALESTKIFKNFYSISEMREFMEAPNGK